MLQCRNENARITAVLRLDEKKRNIGSRVKCVILMPAAQQVGLLLSGLHFAITLSMTMSLATVCQSATCL